MTVHDDAADSAALPAPGGGALAEFGRDMEAGLAGYMDGTVREWRELLAALQTRYDRAAWKPEGERQQIAGLLDFTRWSLDAFERMGREGPPPQEHLTPADFAWHDVAARLRQDEADGLALIGRIKAAAREELAAARPAAVAVEGRDPRPMDRAEFMAVREALADGLRPANGAEWLLIDAMTQALVLHRRWLGRMTLTDSLEAVRFDRNARLRGEYEPPRLSDVESVDRAALLADRFQRQFLRLLKAYRDQRRVFGTIVVAGGQVNIAADGGKQVVANRARVAARRGGAPTARAAPQQGRDDSSGEAR